MKLPDKILNLDEMIDFFNNEGQQSRNPKKLKIKDSENFFNVAAWLTELKNIKLQQWINYEDPTMFKSWIAKFKISGEIEFRDDFINLLSADQKKKIKRGINKVIKKIKKINK